MAFQCSSASRKFLKSSPTRGQRAPRFVSVLFSEPKIPQKLELEHEHVLKLVSVLFSEPKIPQTRRIAGFTSHLRAFQCSSASRKFLKFTAPNCRARSGAFQCSSASRKFLKSSEPQNRGNRHRSFSALQRAENSSKLRSASTGVAPSPVSVLFSEPKIPQKLTSAMSSRSVSSSFSALQRAENSSKCTACCTAASAVWSFSALQRAENSSKPDAPRVEAESVAFQCSSASRKFLKVITV